MSPDQGLGRQLAWSMALVATTTLILTVVGFYAVYYVILLVDPQALPESAQAEPAGIDGLILIGVLLLGVAFAVVSAVRLTRRILQPLHAVTDAARRIAAGDLGARAERDLARIGETSRLVEDFNVMAERLDRMARDMIVWNAAVAHELRTPLTILRGRLQGLADGVFVADEATIGRLLHHVDALSRLVEDLRVISLVDSGRMPLDLSVVELASAIREFVPLVRPELQKAGFQIALELAPGDVRIDRGRMRQALLALLDNAARHADPCVLLVMLRLTPDTLELGVVDQGPGLAPDFVEEAFGVFTRGGEPATRQKGSGLGLSVVRAISRAHGGDVYYRRAASASSFVITVPRWATEPPSATS